MPKQPKEVSKDDGFQALREANEAIANYIENTYVQSNIAGAPSTVAFDDSSTDCVFEPHAGREIMQMSDNIKSQITTFADAATDYGHDVSAPLDPTRSMGVSEDDQLGNFFERPIKIYETGWGVGTTLSDSFNPWKLFFEQTRISNRISNFNMCSCTLHLKFVINGNSFHYGRILTSYLPFYALDGFSNNSGLVPQDAIKESQCPHIFLNPTDSTGGTLVLPFFFHKDMFSIPLGDWDEMGEIFLRSLNALKHANGANDTAFISVFAWAENMQLAMPTSLNASGLSPQSGKESEIDEANRKGFISGPATVVAKVAKGLAAIPQIAPFAVATSEVATLTASIAKRFGYCAPPMTKTPEPFKPRPTSSFALTNVPQAVEKLTVDDKQELSIDPNITGLGPKDPLAIKNIACRESYLTTFNWAVGTAADTKLYNMYVDPAVHDTSGAGPIAYHLPATAAASWPFEYWTGSMKIRFQIVCSNHHKGRLRFVYDPNVYDGTDEYNTNYSEVVDIADKRDFTFTIGMAQPVPIRRRLDPLRGDPRGFASVDLPNYSSFDIGNGTLSVMVVNQLTVPNSDINNDIQINVFVSAGDDFEVFAPDDNPAYYVFKPQMGREFDFEPHSGTEEALAHAGDNAEEDAPEQQNSNVLSVPMNNMDNKLNMVYMGENISSFRTILKRYQLHTSLYAGAQGSRLFSGRFPAFPYWRGNVPNPVNNRAGGAGYNFCNTVMIHWVTQMFSGWRGSIRWRFIPRGAQLDEGLTMQIYAQRAPATEQAKYNQVDVGIPSTTNPNAAAHDVVAARGSPTLNNAFAPPEGLRGMTYTDIRNNPALDIEIPYYNRYRFSPGRNADYTGIDIAGERPWTECVDYRIYSFHAPTGYCDVYCSAGEDFTPFFFTGMPRIYLETSPPLPA